MRISLFTIIPLMIASASSKLLVDYKGGQAATVLGNPEIEGQNRGDKPTNPGNKIYIKPGKDPLNGLQALHYHRDPHYRRTEVRALANKIQKNKTYYIGYHLRLTKSFNNLVIFQWKKYPATGQNIPFHLEFEGSQLTLAYTVPNGARTARWTGAFKAGVAHKIGLVVNTAANGKGFLEFYLDGKKQKFTNGKTRLTGLTLLSDGTCSPKFGMYRAEQPASEKGNKAAHSFDSYVYRVMISDKSMAEVRAASGTSG
ncbi:hypothetical protein EDC01DRAFT_618727 [Geopyxis carbonaria]|nr:hypothetical protein EDC01DRAFT_618727 [Geopyxis carbonaria]